MISCRHKAILWIAAAMPLALFAACCAEEKYAKAAADGAAVSVPLKELSEQLLAVVKKSFPGGKILSASKAPHTPQMLDTDVLNLKVRDGKNDIVVMVVGISGSYAVNRTAKEVPLAEVPKVTIEAVNQRYPAATIGSVHEVQSGLVALQPWETRPSEYEFSIVTADKRSIIVCFAPELTFDSLGKRHWNSGKFDFQWETENKARPK